MGIPVRDTGRIETFAVLATNSGFPGPDGANNEILATALKILRPGLEANAEAVQTLQNSNPSRTLQVSADYAVGTSQSLPSTNNPSRGNGIT